MFCNFITQAHHQTVANKVNIHGSMKVIFKQCQNAAPCQRTWRPCELLMWDDTKQKHEADSLSARQPWGSWGQHGAHLGPTGPRWALGGPINLAIWENITVTVTVVHIWLVSIIKFNKKKANFTYTNRKLMHCQCPHNFQWQLDPSRSEHLCPRSK